MNEIDLHIHSTVSDGSMSPEEIIVYAKKLGLKAISITDHDTLGHIEESLAAGIEHGLEVLPGIEVSAQYEKGTMHILGYFIDYRNDGLFNMLLRFREGREERNPKIIKKLNDLGIDINYEEVLKEAAGQSVGRPHIAKVLYDKGYVSNVKEAFYLYLAKGAPAYCDRFRFGADIIIKNIHGAGGLSFLAHPKQLNCKSEEELGNVVRELVESGLDGIEVYSSSHKSSDEALYKKISEKYGLLVSGGSDFHGLNKYGVELAVYGSDVVKYELVEKMKERLGI